jgi:histidine triad (HIT) family protein
MPNCIFCEILAGRVPGSFAHRDDQVAAIMDVNPVNPGHVLVIPVAHASHLADLPPETGARMFVVAQRLVAATGASGVRCDGVNLVLSDGACAGQEVLHSHLHVIPRFADDGVRIRFRERFGPNPPREELDRIAEAIRRA